MAKKVAGPKPPKRLMPNKGKVVQKPKLKGNVKEGKDKAAIMGATV